MLRLSELLFNDSLGGIISAGVLGLDHGHLGAAEVKDLLRWADAGGRAE
jgi:hypothetical protein